MGRIIELTLDEKVYKIEFVRLTLLQVADLQEEVKNAKTVVEQYKNTLKLIKIALSYHHPDISDEEVERIANSVGDTKEFSDALIQVVNESVNAIKSENKGNAHWVVK